MITKETAELIWSAHREIECARQLLEDMAAERDRKHLPQDAATLRDAFGAVQHLQLGIPCGKDSHRLYRVSPKLAESAIRSHIATMESELAVANERARIELDAA